MKVLLLNGGPHREGCIHRALAEVASALQAEGIETEIFHVGNEPVRSCTGSVSYTHLDVYKRQVHGR